MTAVEEADEPTTGHRDVRAGGEAVDAGHEDLLRAIALVVAAGGDDCDTTVLRLEGDPWSKSRPRHTRTGRSYVAPEDRDAEQRTRARLQPAFLQPMTGNVAVAAIFYRSNRQRIDADNLLKHICDAGTGVAWADDSQVTAVLGVIELDPTHPRTVVAFAPHDSSMGRGTDWTTICPRCNEVFVVDPKRPSRRYCSAPCAARARGHVLADPVPCAHCGVPFRRTTTAQRMCSPDCRAASLAGRNRARATDRPFSACSTCGAQLTHRRGGQCRACWTTGAAGARIEVRAL